MVSDPQRMHFYGVAEPIIGERPQAFTIIRRGRVERIHLGVGVMEGLIEVSYDQLPAAFRTTVHDWFWRERA